MCMTIMTQKNYFAFILNWSYRSWQHVSTPMFIITSQWNGKKFDEITCNLDPEKDQNYGAYVTGDRWNIR